MKCLQVEYAVVKIGVSRIIANFAVLLVVVAVVEALWPPLIAVVNPVPDSRLEVVKFFVFTLYY